MASKNFSGVLRDPLGTLANNDKYRFTHVSTTGEVIRGSTSYLTIGDDGVYNIDIEYGNVSIESYSELGKRWIAQGTTTINANTTATTLPALLNALVPASDALILQLEALLADAESAADRAESVVAGFGTAAAADVTTSPTDTTSGRVMTVGWGGFGGNRLPKVNYGNDLKNLFAGSSVNGLIYEVAVDTVGRPSFANPSVAGILVKYESTCILYSHYPLSENGDVYTGRWTGSEIEWRKQYDSGNTNFNEFVFASGDRKLGVGRESGAEVYVELPLNSPAAPSSVSVTGEFTIYNINNPTIVSSNVVPVFKGFSSNKNLILGFTASVVAGNNYYITPTSGTTATIKVNF